MANSEYETESCLSEDLIKSVEVDLLLDLYETVCESFHENISYGCDTNYDSSPQIEIILFDVDIDDCDVVNGNEEMSYQIKITNADNAPYDSDLCSKNMCQDEDVCNGLSVDLFMPNFEMFHEEMDEVSSPTNDYLFQPEVCVVTLDYDEMNIDVLFSKEAEKT